MANSKAKMKKKVKKRNAGSKKSAPKASTAKSFAFTPSTNLSPEIFILMVLGALLVGVVFLQMDQFRWLGVPFPLPARQLNDLLFLGAIVFGAGYWMLPPSRKDQDLSRWVAYPLLAVVFGVGAYLRFYRLGESTGYYWDDPAYNIIDPRSVVDLHQFYILFPIGSREPLFPYVLSFVYWLFPAWKGLVVQRVGANIFNLAAIWIFYLLGREVSGKRTVGVIMAALVAVSKPALLQNVCGMGGLTLIFGVGLFLLFQFRVFRKPNLAHFLEWGGALAIGLYTYNAARAWTPFLAFILLGWIFWKYRGERLFWPVRAILFFFALLFVPSYLDKMLGVLNNNPITKLWAPNFTVWFFWQAFFLTALIYGYRSAKGKSRVLCSWALGLLLTGILIYPLTTLPDAIHRISSISLLPKSAGEIFSMKFFNLMIEQLSKTIQAVFVWGEDRADMNVVGDPFLDYHAAVLVVLGLAAMVARPTWQGLFLFICAWVGVIPRILTADPQSAKTLGALPSLLYFAALALSRWLEAAWSTSWKKRWMGILLILGLLAFWGWEGRSTFTRVYDKWWAVETDDVRLAKYSSQDIPANRVYLVGVKGFGFMSSATQGVLQEGRDLYLFRETLDNLVDVSPNEPQKDVVVYVSPRAPEFVDRLKKEFPKADWSSYWQYYQTPGEGQPFAYRVHIPASQIPTAPGKSFRLEVVPNPSWLRRTYVTNYGLCRGMIQLENRSPTLNPMPVEAGAHCNSAEGIWEAPADGDYTFSIYTPDLLQLWIDGKMVIDFKADRGAEKFSKTVHFLKGPHQVRFLAYLKVNLRFADITIRNKDLNYNLVLGAPNP